jgi:NAD(P) transhydrogenase subunit beta
MSDTLYYVFSALLSLGVLLGIRWMSKVETAVRGNRLSALCMLIAVILVFIKAQLLPDWLIWVGLAVGTVLGIVMAQRAKMITMPQMVALLNGLGGAASAFAALITLEGDVLPAFELATAMIALMVGAFTLSGSLVAAGKLHRLMPQQPIVLPGHRQLTAAYALGMVLLLVLALVSPQAAFVLGIIALIIGLLFGLLFALPVGGADMPITISLLNSTSGVAAAIAGMAIGDVLLVSVGGIVGASGLLLTQIMCRSMNRKLSAILSAKGAKTMPTPAAPFPAETTHAAAATSAHTPPSQLEEETGAEQSESEVPAEIPAAASQADLPGWLQEAQEVIIIPGYGMAVSQAQELVKQLHDKLKAAGKHVRFAIHPVAGRMPGHMNVLLAEVDIPYDELFEMDDINPDMEKADLVLVIGANDVINPAANTAEGTPIYGMPVLDAAKARRLIICNFDLKPGYAGVPNPLYEPASHILLLLGDAKDSLSTMLAAVSQ